MKHPLISFIIPAYNVGKYIERAVASIEEATYEIPHEIIVVDDGSVDSTSEICDNLAESKCVSTVHTPNRGAASARNTGIDLARGEWIWMVDADDKIYPQSLSVLKEFMRQDVDVITFNHSCLEASGVSSQHTFGHMKMVTGIEYLDGNMTGYLWDKVYRRSFVGSMRLKEGLVNTEDFHFVVRTLKGAHKVVCLPDALYEYNCTNLQSTLRRGPRKGHGEKVAADSLSVHLDLWAARNEWVGNQRILKKLLSASIAGLLLVHVSGGDSERARDIVHRYQEVGLFPLARTGRRKMDTFGLLSHLPSSYVFLSRIIATRFGHKYIRPLLH